MDKVQAEIDHLQARGLRIATQSDFDNDGQQATKMWPQDATAAQIANHMRSTDSWTLQIWEERLCLGDCWMGDDEWPIYGWDDDSCIDAIVEETPEGEWTFAK